MNQQQAKIATGVAALAGLLLLTGCATSAPAPASSSAAAPAVKSVPAVPVSQEESRPAIVCANDSVKVRVETASGVSVGDYRKSQLEQQIQERLEAKKALNKTAGRDRQYEVTVTLTSFKRGSSLERLISGKMGEIDIDSVVRLHDVAAGRQLSEFTMRENFTRGGIGGFATSYLDAESSFADGIAVALTGQVSPRSTNAEWTLR